MGLDPPIEVAQVGRFSASTAQDLALEGFSSIKYLFSKGKRKLMSKRREYIVPVLVLHPQTPYFHIQTIKCSSSYLCIRGRGTGTDIYIYIYEI
jgi:hypothetical protein